MEEKPQLYVIAGPNGAGKSTTSYLYLENNSPGLKAFDGDKEFQKFKDEFPSESDYRIDKKLIEKFDRTIKEKIKSKLPFAYETNFVSLDSMSTVRNFKHFGYNVHLVYYGVQDVNICKDRVKQRVESNTGHDVDHVTIERNYIKGLKEVKRQFNEFKTVVIIDNSSLKNREFPLSIMEFKDGEKIYQSKNVPNWIIKEFSELYNKPIINLNTVKMESTIEKAEVNFKDFKIISEEKAVMNVTLKYKDKDQVEKELKSETWASTKDEVKALERFSNHLDNKNLVNVTGELRTRPNTGKDGTEYINEYLDIKASKENPISYNAGYNGFSKVYKYVSQEIEVGFNKSDKIGADKKDAIIISSVGKEHTVTLKDNSVKKYDSEAHYKVTLMGDNVANGKNLAKGDKVKLEGIASFSLKEKDGKVYANYDSLNPKVFQKQELKQEKVVEKDKGEKVEKAEKQETSKAKSKGKSR